jgi:multidrug efflux pump subunit AcrA (membrane-fusion protein)
LTIPGVQAGLVRIGQTVRATVDAFPEQSFTGRISAVNPAISAEARSFLVEARVPNPDAFLKPGMFAVATIDQGRTMKTMLVPARAVIDDANTNSHRVFVIDKENKARLRVVQLAAAIGDRLGFSPGFRRRTASRPRTRAARRSRGHDYEGTSDD